MASALKSPTAPAGAGGGKFSWMAHVKYEHLMAGVSGGVTSTLLLHPLDLIKIRFAGECNPLFLNILTQCVVDMTNEVSTCLPRALVLRRPNGDKCSRLDRSYCIYRYWGSASIGSDVVVKDVNND